MSYWQLIAAALLAVYCIDDVRSLIASTRLAIARGMQLVEHVTIGIVVTSILKHAAIIYIFWKAGAFSSFYS